MTDRFEATRQPSVARHLTLLLLASIGASCRGEKPAPVDTARAAAGSAAPVVSGVEVAPQTFRTLKWIEGRWRGTDSSQLVFYEEYRFVDDSTIAMRSFSDSMFSTPTDSSVVALRGGRVENVAANATWVVTAFYGNSVHFAPVKGARNRFIWERAATGWTARLFNPTDTLANGRLYHMTPVVR
jgi:hypothetical protein